MAYGNNVDWYYVEHIIQEDPNRPRKVLANLGGCSEQSNIFKHLCTYYGVPTKRGGKARVQPERYGPAPRPSRKAKTYFVKCPTCEKWWEYRSDLKPDSNRMYCHKHEYARRNSSDQNALYNAGVK